VLGTIIHPAALVLGTLASVPSWVFLGGATIVRGDDVTFRSKIVLCPSLI
jgi:hypothetical protein